MTKIDVHYFPKAMQYTILVLSLGGIYFLIQNKILIILPALIIINLLLFTRKFQIVIDMNRQLLIDKNLVFGFSFKTKKVNFKQLNYIEIDKKRVHYTANSRAKTGVTDYFEYIGNLVYDENEIFEFRRSVEFNILKSAAEELANQLDLEVRRVY